MVHGLSTFPTKPWRDRRVLELLYVDEGLTQREIGEIFGKAKTTICKWLRRVGIKTRGGYTNPYSDGPWTKKDVLEELYIEQELTQAEIGDKFDQSPRTIRRWLHRHGIETRIGRPPGGEGSSSLYYGPQWPQQRARVIDRDGRQCACCETDRDVVDPDLNVHHITPAREFIPDDGQPNYEAMNALSNLISLCPSCHSRFEGNWQDCTPDEFARRAKLALEPATRTDRSLATV